jgi:hypothetical protein
MPDTPTRAACSAPGLPVPFVPFVPFVTRRPACVR